MKRCSNCILPEEYPRISFDEEGICNYCNNSKGVLLTKKDLDDKIRTAQKKNRIYDALVPLSGGKDSTYVLYLTKRVYRLNVLAYTYDNGFFSDAALNNIRSAVQILNVDHIFIKPNWDMLRRLYRHVLLETGEICTMCSIGIVHNYLKISEDWRIPLILDGSSSVEKNSGTPEEIYDISRLKAVFKDASDVSSSELKRFLIYENMNPAKRYLYQKTGKFGTIVRPLQYSPKIKETDIINILKKEVAWQEGARGKQKHFDCLAEPFTNYMREKRLGFSRRVCQYSNLIRFGEMTREEALQKISKEKPEVEPETTNLVLEKLGISREQFSQTLKIPPYKYDKYVYHPRIVKMARKILKY